MFKSVLAWMSIDVTLEVTVSVCVRLSLRSPPSATVTAFMPRGGTNISAVRITTAATTTQQQRQQLLLLLLLLLNS